MKRLPLFLAVAFWLLPAFGQSILTAGGLASFIGTNAASGGGGGGSWTIIDHKSIAASGTVTTLTVSGLNTVGADLVFFVGVHQGTTLSAIGSTSPSDTVTASSSFTNSSPKVQGFWVIGPTQTASYSATVSSGGNHIDSIDVFSVSKGGSGTVAFDIEGNGGSTFNWQGTTVSGGSKTPSTSADLVFSAVAWDVFTTTSASVNSGFTTSPDGVLTHTFKALSAYKIKTDSLPENPGWTGSPTSNADANTSHWWFHK